MIKPGAGLTIFEGSPSDKSFYNGTLNFKQLDYDPLVTGYAVIIWDELPSWVTAEYPDFAALSQKNFLAFSGIEDFQIETQDYQYGFNNNSYNTAVGITKNNTEFTITHKEFSGNPIKNMYQHWVTNIFDPETGISPYGRIYNLDFKAQNHTGSLMYIVLRPDVNNIEKKNIEFAAYFTKVFPKKVPLSHFEFQQGNRDHVQIEIPFSGVMHLSAKVDEYAKLLLNGSYSYLTMGMFDPQNRTPGAATIRDFDISLAEKSNE